MANGMTNLPTDVDKFLMDMAQMFGEFDYTDIIDFSKVADSQQINGIRLAAADLADLDFEIYDDEEASIIFEGIVDTVKGKQHA